MAINPILVSADIKRRSIHEQAILGLGSLFPIEEGSLKINVINLRVKPQDYSLNNVKTAIIQGKSLTEPITGDLTVHKDGKLVFKKDNYLLMRVPFLTSQHTFVVDGNSYMVGSQLRTRPGIYARFRRNDVPEVSFNLAKGANFKVVMNPESLLFSLEYGSSKTPLYPIIHALGFPDLDIRKLWGRKIFDSNKISDQNTIEKSVTKIYQRLVPIGKRDDEDATLKEKSIALRDYFKNTQLDAETTKLTMGMGFRNVNGLALAAAGKRLVDLLSKNEEVDDRDSLEFQTINSIDDFVKERIIKGGKEVVNKIKFRVKNMKGSDKFDKVVPSAPFNKTIKSLITQFTLSRTPDQINPIEMLDGVMKVTRMGEGGISSIRAVPNETRELHPSHLGLLDPVRTPESHNIGVDLRATVRMGKDEAGRMYTSVRKPGSKKLDRKYVGFLKNKRVAFPNQKGPVRSVIYQGKITEVPSSKVDYEIPHSTDMFGPSSTLIPFVNNMQGNRALMGSKQITQALPLKYREEPLVQVEAPEESDFDSMHYELGSKIIKHAPEDGKIVKVDEDYIHFKGTSGKKYQMPYASNLPFNSKTYLDETIVAPVGKAIKKGSLITDSNYTKNGAVSLGINARIAYVPYNGLNSNDAIVISESAAKKFTSLHMYKEILEVDKSTVLGKQNWITKFPNKISREQFGHYNNNGVIRKGSIINYGDPVILALREVQPNQTDIILGKLDKNLRSPVRDASVIWMKDFPGVVTDIYESGNRIIVTLKVEAVAQEGDKLSGQFGNKGVIGKILPDDQMLHDKNDRPMDVLVTSAGVATRINPSQLLETATGKVASKLGKPIIIRNFSGENDVKKTQQRLKKHGVDEKETLIDPMTGREIPNIFTGDQYMMKLFKSTDTNFAARNTGSYTIDQQPAKGGKHSASRIGSMEFNTLLAHGVPNVLKEVSGVKSQKNHDWWQAYQRGTPTPDVKRPFIVNKFLGMLNGAQIKVKEWGDKLGFSPLTDEDTIKQSSGKIDKAVVLRSKDLKPEKGGLFDPTKTGGLEGEKWSHIELDERIVKPMYRKPTASLLGMSSVELDKESYNKGGDYIHGLLKKLDIPRMKSESREIIETGKGQKLDHAIKRYNYIAGLEKAKLRPEDAYTGKTLPVIPPYMRPIVPGPNDTLLVADANHLYRDTILASTKLRELKEAGLPDEDIALMRREVAESVGAVVGLNDPISRKLQQQGKKGFIKQISGSKPSQGLFQRKLIGRSQDISGRGTIAPDPTLGVDQIGLPEDTAFGMFKPMLIRNMVRKGYPALEALKHVEDKTDTARVSLNQEMAARPIIYNRAPTLHRGNMLSAYASLVPGKTIRINPFSELSLNADFDGDAVQLQVPVGFLAQNDAKKMLLSNNTFGDINKNDLIVKPQHEAIIGIHDVLSQKKSGKSFSFKSMDEAKLAYLDGSLKANDTVVITG